jgi:uncharacterized protein YegJ (DUF2314 family)
MFGRFLDAVLGRNAGSFTVTKSGELDVAIAQARDTLPSFWRRFEASAADEFEIKAGLTTPNGAVEHVWMTPCSWRDGKILCRLLSAPVDLEDVGLGDEVLVLPERISDWSYWRDGKLYGAYTERALLDRMDKGARRQLEAVLAPLPLESDTY